MEEKLQTLFQDQALRNAQRRNDASTFQTFATSDANSDAGRFAAVNKSNVVGATPVPEYPRLPDQHWNNDPVPPEPPYDGDMSTPIVGESWEIEASLNAAPATASGSLPQDAVAVERATGEATQVEPGSPLRAGDPMPESVVSPNQLPARRR